MINRFIGEYRFLSNFYPSLIFYKNKFWPTVEHAYQAEKTDSEQCKHLIRLAQTPGDAKRLGRRAKLRPDWEQVKDSVMLDLVRLKFLDTNLASKLLSTGDIHLEEGNNWGDTYWGTCSGVGENKLGKILMQVREELVK